MDLVCLGVLGGIGRGLADNLQKGRRDARVPREHALYIDLHAHQTKGVNDIAQLLFGLAGAIATQIGGD